MNYPAHFDLNNEAAYQKWREQKLSYYCSPILLEAVNITDYKNLTQDEKIKIDHSISRFNFALYHLIKFPRKQTEVPKKIAQQLQLSKSDIHLCGDDLGLSQIKVTEKRGIGEYIPYTNHAINWHTDGYYNDADKKIHSMILHCEQSALAGGDNAFIDHEIIYILLRDENPDFITVLSDENAMIIPENRQNNHLIRPEQAGPVFSVSPWGLHMRYTARTKSIVWQKDELTQQAVARIREIYNEDSVYKIKYRLQPGEGIVSNNIMHMRTGFTNGDSVENTRLYYRMRFYQPLPRFMSNGFKKTG